MSLSVSFEDILAARQRLRGVAEVTPVLRSAAADQASGAQLFFKCENLQPMGAFKIRGAYNAIAQFTPEQRRRGVVTFSSGNHAQAIALAARMLDVKATIVMPEDAPRSKLEATRSHGAEVTLFDRYAQDPVAIVGLLVEQQGLTLVPPFDHPHVIAGQGTLALELLEQAGPLDALVTPVGGGGLLSGCSIAASQLSPGIALHGVEPEAGNDAQQSLAAGRIVKIDTPRTIADAAQSRSVGEHTFPILRRHVKSIVTVSDEALAQTVRFMAQRLRLVVEPTGCLAAAALLHGQLDLAGRRVGVVLSGGNVDLDRLAGLLA